MCDDICPLCGRTELRCVCREFIASFGNAFIIAFVVSYLLARYRNVWSV